MPHAAHSSALPASLAGYERRRPEQTLLHQTLAAYWPRFAQRCDEHYEVTGRRASLVLRGLDSQPTPPTIPTGSWL